MGVGRQQEDRKVLGDSFSTETGGQLGITFTCAHAHMHTCTHAHTPKTARLPVQLSCTLPPITDPLAVYIF